MTTKQNKWLDALIAALAARRNHEEALKALISHHGGKRTMPLMEDLLAGLRAVYPKTDAEIRAFKGQPNISFPNKGVGYQLWKDEILPHLPKLRKATGGARHSVDPVERFAKTIMKELSAAQIRRLKALI